MNQEGVIMKCGWLFDGTMSFLFFFFFVFLRWRRLLNLDVLMLAVRCT